MNIRHALLSAAVLALPLSHAAFAGDAIRAGAAQQYQGTPVIADTSATTAIHSREVLEYPGKLGNGDIQASQVAFTRSVRSSQSFGFGQAGWDGATPMVSRAKVATGHGNAETTQGN